MEKLTFRAMRTIHVLVIIALLAGLMPSASPALAARSQARPPHLQATETTPSQTNALSATPEAADSARSGNTTVTNASERTLDEGFVAADELQMSTSSTFDFSDGPQGWTTFPHTYSYDSSECTSEAFWVNGDLCDQHGYWDANICQTGPGEYPNKGKWIGIQYPSRVSFDGITWDYRQWGGVGTVGGTRLRVYTSDDRISWSQEYTTWSEDTQQCRVYTTNWPVSNKFVRIVVEGYGILGNNPQPTLNQLTFTNFTLAPFPSDRTHAPEDPCLANNPQARAADPVNTRTGNLTHQQVDVAIPTRGLPLTLERSYNSLDTYAGPLGRGWTHNYNMHLTVEGPMVTLMAPRGSRLRFTDEGGGAFAAGAGVRATLVRHADDTYTLSRGDQIVYTFNAAGRLTALADTQANTTTLTYSGDNLTAVTAPDGRALTLTYDGQGRITQLTDPLGRTVGYTYDANGNLATVTDRRGKVTGYAYDATGHLTTLTDPNGHTVANAYDAQGRVSTQTDALSQATTFAYQASQTVVTDRNGHATTHTYDPIDRLESLTDPLGQTTHYTYDEDHNLATVTDPLGRTTHFTWNDCGCSVTSITDPLDQTTRFVYDGRNNLVSHTDPLSRTTSFAYDGQDNLTVITNTLGVTVTFAYDAYGQLLASSDANGHTTHYAYDANGNLAVITDTLNQVTGLSYDLAGRLTQITNPKSQITQYQYDPGDNLVKITDALDGETSYGYDAVGNTMAITDANLHSTALAYDAADRLITTTNALGAQTVYGYDPAGNLAQITHPESQITHYQYDAADRLTAVVDPLGNTTGYGYNAVGNLTVITDARGLATHYGYDALNRLTSVTDALDGETSYGYDAIGNRTVITDANGHVSRFTYDGLNRLASRADPLNHTWSYGYDPVGNLVQVTDPQSQITNYLYDALNRLTTMDYPAQGDVSFTYDPLGNRLSMAGPTGSTTYAYDALNRLTSVAHPGGGTVGYGYDAVGNRVQLTKDGGQATNYAYDAANRLTTVTDWSSDQYAYSYDDAGRVTSLEAPNGVRSSFHYDDAGRLTCLDHSTPEGVLSGYRYTLDDVGNRTQVVESQTPCLSDIYLPIIMKNASGGGTMALTGRGEGQQPAVVPGLFESPIPTPTPIPPATIEGLIAALDAAYQQGQIDNEGVYHSLRTRLTQAQDDINQGQADKAVQELEAFVNEVEAQRGKHVTEEAADRLMALAQQLIAQLSNPQPPTSNPQLLTSNPPTVVTYTYDSLYRLTGAAYSAGESFAYTYDAVGNRTQQIVNGVTINYTYDAANRLTQVNGQAYTFDDNGNLLSTGVSTYTWDAANHLTQVSRGGNTLQLIYNGVGDRVAQIANGDRTDFTLDAAGGLPEVIYTSKGDAYLHLPGIIVQQKAGQGKMYLLRDGLGSVRQTVDGTGAVVTYHQFGPYGNPMQNGGDPYGYTGEWWEDEVGLLYLRARWYAPEDGIFLSKDTWSGSIFRPQSLHGWSYVEGNPVNWVDPSGRCWGPMEFLRRVPGYGTTCSNLDMAILIAGHPQTSAYQKAQAVAYVEAVAISHLILAEALVIGGYGWLLETGVIGGELSKDLDECSKPSRVPPPYPADPTQPPGPGWEWRGSGPPGSSQGAWFNPDTLQSLHPDFDHPAHEPHYDYNYRGSDSEGWRYYPDGRLERK